MRVESDRRQRERGDNDCDRSGHRVIAFGVIVGRVAIDRVNVIGAAGGGALHSPRGGGPRLSRRSLLHQALSVERSRDRPRHIRPRSLRDTTAGTEPA